MDEQSIFLTALEKSSTEEIAAWLDESCGRNAQLRKRIEALLRRHHEENSFLRHPLDAVAATCLAAEDMDIASNHASVLRSIGRRYGAVKGVALPDAEQQLEDPVVQIGSTQVPQSKPADRYQFLGEIARGGMGAVIKGRDTDLGRDLAVKVLLDDHKDKPEIVQRFVEEAQIGGQLQHPGIAPVYELGQFADHRPFFTMKLIKGKTLAAMLSRRKTPGQDQAKLLGIFEQICQTMAYAHSRQVIHRDLKPANIMVGAFGEVQVMDWGLAKVLQSGGIADETNAAKQQQDMSVIATIRSGGTNTFTDGPSAGSETRAGSVMGTPAYMPPEQAIGQAAAMDERSDVFGLGAILCEILTGHPPYIAADGNEVLRKAVRGDLAECQKRLQDCDAHPDLVGLTLRCLAADPAERPEDAGAVTDHITNHLESVSKKLKVAEMRRKLTYVGASSLLLLAIGLGGGGVWLKAKETEAANQVAQAEKQSNEELQQALYASDIQLAGAEYRMGNVQRAATILASRVPEPGKADRRGFEWHFLNRLCPQPRVAEHVDWLEGHVDDWHLGPNRKHQLCPDWKRALHWSAADSSEDENRYRLVVTEPESGKEIWSTEITRPASTDELRTVSAISDDGSTVYFYAHGRNAKDVARLPIDIWKVDSDEHHVIELKGIKLLDAFDRAFLASKISPDGRYFVVGLPSTGPTEITSLSIWRVGQHEPIYSMELNEDLQSLRLGGFSPDGEKMLLTVSPRKLDSSSAAEDVVGVLKVIETKTGELLHSSRLEPFYTPWPGTFSPDGSMIALTGVSTAKSESPVASLLWIVDANTGQRLCTISPRDDNPVFAPVFTPDGKVVCLPRSGELFSTSEGASLGKLAQMLLQPPFVRFTPDGRSIVGITRSRDLMQWNIPRPQFEQAAFDVVGSTFVSPDGTHAGRTEFQSRKAPRQQVDIYSIDGSHRVLNTKRTIHIHPYGRQRTFSHDCRFVGLVTRREDKLAQHPDRRPEYEATLWEIESGELAATLWGLKEHEHILHFVGVPKRNLMAGVIQYYPPGETPTNQLIIWDLGSFTKRVTLDLQDVGAIAFSADGMTVAIETATVDGDKAQLTLYNVDDTKRLAQFLISPIRPDAYKSQRLVFSPDGSAVAAFNPVHRCVDVWDVERGRKLQSLAGISRESQFTWSKTGDRIIAFLRDQNQLKVWDARTGRQLLVQPDHRNPSASFQLLPDREQIVGWNNYGPPSIWDGTPKDDQ